MSKQQLISDKLKKFKRLTPDEVSFLVNGVGSFFDWEKPYAFFTFQEFKTLLTKEIKDHPMLLWMLSIGDEILKFNLTEITKVSDVKGGTFGIKKFETKNAAFVKSFTVPGGVFKPIDWDIKTSDRMITFAEEVLYNDVYGAYDLEVTNEGQEIISKIIQNCNDDALLYLYYKTMSDAKIQIGGFDSSEKIKSVYSIDQVETLEALFEDPPEFLINKTLQYYNENEITPDTPEPLVLMLDDQSLKKKDDETDDKYKERTKPNIKNYVTGIATRLAVYINQYKLIQDPEGAESNYSDSKTDKENQTKAETDWTKYIDELLKPLFLEETIISKGFPVYNPSLLEQKVNRTVPYKTVKQQFIDYLVEVLKSHFDYDSSGQYGIEYIPQFWRYIVGDAIRKITVDAGFDPAIPKEITEALKNTVPIADPADVDKITSKELDVDKQRDYIQQCNLLVHIKEINRLIDDKLKKKNFPFNKVAFNIESETPDLILNSLVMGTGSASRLFEKKLTISIPKGTAVVDSTTGATTLTNEYYEALKDQKNNEKNFADKNDCVITYVDNLGQHYKYRDLKKEENLGFPWTGDETISIELNGTNPSTARSDVKVNYSRDVSDVGSLFSAGNRRGLYKIISRTGEDLTFNSFIGGHLKNNYSFQTGKKSLFSILSTGDKKYSYSYDLSLVKHEINLKNQLAAAELKLEHRGYLESLILSPATDVLGGKDLLKAKKLVQKNIVSQMLKNKCSKEDILEARENIRLYHQKKLINYKSRIIKRLGQLGCIHQLSLGDGTKNTKAADKLNEKNEAVLKYTIDAGLKELVEDTDIFFGSSLGNGDIEKLFSTSTNQILFFTFGDLVAVCLEIFQKDQEKKEGEKTILSNPFTDNKYHNEDKLGNFDNINYQFFNPVALMTPFRFKRIGDTEAVSINISNIPISTLWFSRFLDDQYFKKGAESVPIGQLLRDVLELGMSNILQDSCFTSYLDKKMQFRVSCFRGTKKQFNFAITALGLANKKMINHNVMEKTPFFSSRLDREPYFEYDENKYYSFIYIHAQDPLEVDSGYRKRLLNYTKSGVIPVIRNIDTNQNPYIYVKSFSWSKVENKYERERRYFNSSDFTPYVLGNVYNCTIKTTLLVPFLYPGMIVAINPYLGADQSDPFDKNVSIDTLSKNLQDNLGYQLGLTGFYLITKVKHNYTGKLIDGYGSGETEIVCKNILGLEQRTNNNSDKDCDNYIGLSESIFSTNKASGVFLNQEGTQLVQNLEKVNAEQDTTLNNDLPEQKSTWESFKEWAGYGDSGEGEKETDYFDSKAEDLKVDQANKQFQADQLKKQRDAGIISKEQYDAAIDKLYGIEKQKE